MLPVLAYWQKWICWLYQVDCIVSKQFVHNDGSVFTTKKHKYIMTAWCKSKVKHHTFYLKIKVQIKKIGGRVGQSHFFGGHENFYIFFFSIFSIPSVRLYVQALLWWWRWCYYVGPTCIRVQYCMCRRDFICSIAIIKRTVERACTCPYTVE